MIWSDKEKERLRQLYPHTSNDELERLFPGAKADSIGRRARRMGLKKERSWNKEEEELLLYFWPRMPHKDVAIVMERSYWSVSCKYSRLTAIKKKTK